MSEPQSTAEPSNGPPPRVRIAPSPTGNPHVGTAYIALFNYAFAKSRGGKFILRIEDTDRARSTAASEAAILRALRWVGLNWDEGPDIGGPVGPYRQSERAEIYRAEVAKLMDKGGAYRCFCTPARLEALRHEQRRQGLFVGYDGLCRGRPREEGERRAAAGETFVIRMAMPRTGETAFVDRLRGEIKFENAQIDDQILVKADGFPTYHLANVVDDHLMGITHVIRAEEWLSSTPKHMILYQGFGWASPEWIHMPLLRNADKSKISKRKNPVSLDYYQDAGFLPEALVNFLGTMGWSISGDREKFSLDEMVAAFSWDRVSLGGPVFDLVKLSAMNALYLRELPDAEIVRRLRDWRLSDQKLASLVPLVRARIQRLDEFVPMTDFFFSGDLDYGAVAKDLIPKNREPKDVAEVLGTFSEELDAGRDFSIAGLDALTRAFAEKSGWSTKELFMLLRLAATGKKATPPLFETLANLGRELVRRRLRQCILEVKKLPTPLSAGDPAAGRLRPGEPLGVYVHFPFCAVRCPYCDFAVDTRADIPHDAYAAAVIAEIAARAPWFAGAGPLASIYFGGGTPGLWRPQALGQVIEAARATFGAPAAAELEITVEVNPGEVAVDQLAALRQAGVNRLSIGVQALDDGLLAALGRNHTAGAGPAAVRAARAAGFENLSVDVMFGVPGQSLDGWRRDVDAVVELGPEHVSAYALTIERGTVFGAKDRRGELRRPDDEAVAAMFEHARQTFAAAGLVPYEVSSYAREGRRSRHNQLYWALGPYLGAGASAASFRPLAGGTGWRFSNPRSTDVYLRQAQAGQGSPGPRHVERRSASDLENEAIWLGLRTSDGVDRAAHAARHGCDPLLGREPAVAAAVAAGWLVIAGTRLRLTPAGVLFADEVAARLWRDTPAG